MCISLLSEQDGKGDIVDAAREFCKGVQLKHRTPKQMEPDVFNGILKGKWKERKLNHCLIICTVGGSFNPLTPRSDQHATSTCSICMSSSKQLRRILKLIT